MPLVLDASWVGHRVVVRRRVLDDPVRYADVVGDLLVLTGEAAVLDTRGGEVRVPLAAVAVAKLAAPSSADILTLEAVAERGWRAAERVELDGWVLRADQGFTGRANSALPLRAPHRPLAEQLAAARDWYHARGLPLRLQLPLPARRMFDLAVADRGFPADVDVRVLTARLAGVDLDGVVELAADPSPEWLARYNYRGSTLPPSARALLVRHPRVAFASIRRSGDLLAIARGAVDQGWLGVTAVEVDPSARRQGLASALTRSLSTWAVRSHDATRGYLQVSSDNAAALALYAGLGYRHHHDYRYRTEP
jgi:N-acetylglutamate synthase